MHAALRLTVSDLVVDRGGRRVLDGVGFGVAAGGAVTVTGPNGSGKSTLLRTLAGLVRRLSGEIALHGAGEDGVPEQAHYVGHHDALKPQLTVIENIAFWADVMTGRRSDPLDALARFGLDDLAALPARNLSAGQRRRLTLARLVAIERPVWLLDEPTTAIDAASERALIALIEAHRAAGGLVVAATHAPLGLEGAAALRLEPA